MKKSAQNCYFCHFYAEIVNVGGMVDKKVFVVHPHPPPPPPLWRRHCSASGDRCFVSFPLRAAMSPSALLTSFGNIDDGN